MFARLCKVAGRLPPRQATSTPNGVGLLSSMGLVSPLTIRCSSPGRACAADDGRGRGEVMRVCWEARLGGVGAAFCCQHACYRTIGCAAGGLGPSSGSGCGLGWLVDRGHGGPRRRPRKLSGRPTASGREVQRQLSPDLARRDSCEQGAWALDAVESEKAQFARKLVASLTSLPSVCRFIRKSAS